MFAMPNDIRSNFVKQKIFFLPPPLLNQLYLHITTLTETIVFFLSILPIYFSVLISSPDISIQLAHLPVPKNFFYCKRNISSFQSAL